MSTPGDRDDPARSIEPKDLLFIDVEASSLERGSWPIELGLARILPGGRVVSEARLIRPAPRWREEFWHAESAAVHCIARGALDAAPPAAEVAGWALRELAHRVAVSDAPEFDIRWLRKLLRTVEPDPAAQLHDFDHVVARTFDFTGVARVYRALADLPAPHRAGPDAERLARAFRAGLPRG